MAYVTAVCWLQSSSHIAQALPKAFRCPRCITNGFSVALLPFHLSGQTHNKGRKSTSKGGPLRLQRLDGWVSELWVLSLPSEYVRIVSTAPSLT